MSTVTDNGHSYLEIEGTEARKVQTAKSDYNAENEYNEAHPDALATGDERGKGTGDFGGHGWYVPDMTKPKSEIDYSNFNTWAGGNDCDNNARDVMTARSLYGPGRQYGIDVQINTEDCRRQGQFNNEPRPRTKHVCLI